METCDSCSCIFPSSDGNLICQIAIENGTWYIEDDANDI